jgi:hypothetical protein
MEADVFSRLFTKVVMLAAVAGLASCALQDRVVFVPDSGAGGAQPDTATGADGSDAALAAPGDPPPDQRAVVPPGNWSTEPNREVRNLHMTWQQDPATTVTVQWATNDISLTDYEPRVWAMPSSRVEGAGADAVMPWSASYVYEGEGMIYREALAGFETGTEDFVVWTVELTGLLPDTEYTFRAGTWQDFNPATGEFTSPDLSDPLTVTTGIPKGQREPFKMVMAGDSRGGTEDILANVDRLAAMEARLWFFNGDMTNGGSQVEWNLWQDAMAPVLQSQVLMPVQGNHEIFANLYYAQYALPRHPGLPEELQEHAWSFDFSNVHFVGLDSNTEAVVADQVAWLEADLAAARKDPDIDWIFVMMHHPVYSASNHGSTDRLQEYWMPLFEKHRVDLVFAGHDHNYERTLPVRGGQVVEPDQGVVYVVAGGFYSPGYSNGQGWWTKTSAHGDLSNYLHLSVEGDTVEIIAYSGDGTQVLDQFALTR